MRGPRRRLADAAAALSRLTAGAAAAVLISLAACGGADGPATPHVDSLADLSIAALRARSYGSRIAIEQRVRGKPYASLMTSYSSDGLRVYARYDIPAVPKPDSGYPLIVFLHGWVGIDAAPELRFYYDEDSTYGAMIDTYVDAGFAVVTPGFRGHGSVNGIPADGIEFMAAWDNGSYLSPVFYAIDVLNLLDSLHTVDDVDRERVYVVGHSQGGDVALITLAVAGEGSTLRTGIAAASIWSGTFPSRFTQLRSYAPMETSPRAFLAGDGTWNATAVGADGTINPEFVFGYPADWIGTVDVDQWTWQKETWSAPTTVIPLEHKLGEMYGAINAYSADIEDAEFELSTLPGGRLAIAHDPRVAAALGKIGGFGAAKYLTEPLALQHSDRDFYSFPEWNADLCRRINASGGTCHDFEYPGSNHSLEASEYAWFAPADTIGGFDYALRRDIALFSGEDPAAVRFP